MKRRLALAALLLAASACTTATENTNTGAGNTNANSNTNAAASPTPAGVTQADIEARERQIWEAMRSKNYDAFAGMLADDFVYVSAEGVADKAQTVEAVKRAQFSEYDFSDTRFLKVDEDLAVLTYTTTEKATSEGRPAADRTIRNGSAWVRRGGQWLAAFHQETPATEPQHQLDYANANAGAGARPGPNSNANSNANSNTNSGASGANANTPGAGAGTPALNSATEAERAVWDALKRRDYDAFANFLLPDALEVEADKTYTRAESIEGVKHFDATKFTQTDFKETKLDADATLVTYVVTGPAAGRTVTERHTTLWTNRGGQWRAAFHQGTLQRK